MNSNESQNVLKNVIFEILRYHPEKDEKPYLERYKVPVVKGMTVLEGLTWIKENIDNTLAWRSSCRMGVCGSCGMFINGKARLACNNQIMHIEADVLHIKPLPNFEIIRDLVPNLDDFFQKHRSIKPYIIRDDTQELDEPGGEYFQSPEELNNYIQFAYCIKCGMCLSACPTCATDDEYLGPMALAQAWRYNSDSRDGGAKNRDENVYKNEGVWRCHFAGSCSDVCPKGVDPAFAIQLLKKDIFLKRLKLRKYRTINKDIHKQQEHKPNPKIAKPPDPTVK
jgi:succinate dehydrogenase / fumarate reductase iron-sulfur subunit